MKAWKIFVFKAPMTDKFNEENGLLSHAIILPYIREVSQNSRCESICRQIRIGKDIKTWPKAIGNGKFGKRLI
jgi:hypothetical protein